MVNVLVLSRAHGGAVVEALRNKRKGRGIDSRWCHGTMAVGLTQPLSEMSTRNIS
jgi:hypothetical protein